MTEQELSDKDLHAALDAIDYIFQQAEPFSSPPDESVQEQIEDFVDFMGFHPGTLHRSVIEFNWFYGNLEDPEWMGEMPSRPAREILFDTKPDEPFLVVGVLLLKESPTDDERDDLWTHYLKVLVRDKVGYAPIPIGLTEENGANHFKSLFHEIVTD